MNIREKKSAAPGWHQKTKCVAFQGERLIASGELATVALKAKAAHDRHADQEPLLIFDDSTSEVIEVDYRGTNKEVLRRIPPASAVGELTSSDAIPEASRGPGRPHLGVVAREVTLLPRHWDWLNGQPGGASVALRKLVEKARHDNQGADRVRQLREAAYKFMSAMAGNYPGFEEATRALFAGDQKRFEKLTRPWPVGIRDRARKLAKGTFQKMGLARTLALPI
jgi:hypothetical protein